MTGHWKTKLTKKAQALKAVARDTLREVVEAELPTAASSLAYTTLLSIIPLLAVSFSIFKAFGGLEKLYAAVEPFIFENLAEGSDEKTLNLLRGFVGNIHAGTLGVTGFIALVVTSMAMLASVEKTINKVWKAPITRSLFSRISSYWLFITLGPIAASLTIGFVTSKDVPLHRILPGNVLIFFMLVPAFWLLYRFVPNRKVHWKAALFGSMLTSFAWVAAKAGYSFYIRRYVSYEKIYGSLAAIPIFVLWIYVAWLVVLGGAAVSASFQRRYELK